MVSKEVILANIRGDRQAHKHLYDACAPYVYTIVKNYIYDREFRKDAMQEVFAHIFHSIHRYDEEKGEFKTWVGRIAVNRCIVLLRKSNLIDYKEDISELAETPYQSFDYLNNLTKDDIENMLSQMPEGYRTVFLLNIIDGYKHDEIAQMLNIAIGTSRSQLNRGLSWIRSNISLEQQLK